MTEVHLPSGKPLIEWTQTELREALQAHVLHGTAPEPTYAEIHAELARQRAEANTTFMKWLQFATIVLIGLTAIATAATVGG